MGETWKETGNLESFHRSSATSCVVLTRRQTMSTKPATDSSKQRSHDEAAESISWSNKELREAQLADGELRMLMEWKEADGKRPDWSELSHRNSCKMLLGPVGPPKPEGGSAVSTVAV